MANVDHIDYNQKTFWPIDSNATSTSASGKRWLAVPKSVTIKKGSVIRSHFQSEGYISDNCYTDETINLKVTGSTVGSYEDDYVGEIKDKIAVKFNTPDGTRNDSVYALDSVLVAKVDCTNPVWGG